MADNKAKLTTGSKGDIDLDILSPTIGQDVIDVRTLGSKGFFTYDPGFTSTASCESKITYIDGDQGILLHRGFPIDQLATEASYLEVCYILLYGEAPTQEQYDVFKNTVTRHTMIHEQITRMLNGFRRDSHPMAVLCGVTGALAAFYHDALMLTTHVTVKLRLIACCQKCQQLQRCVTNIQLANLLFIHVMTCHTRVISCT